MNSNVYGEETGQKIELFLNARGLGDMDFFSKSDPYVKVYFKRHPNENIMFMGRTETIMNDLNPNFTKSFIVDYIFQTRQQLRFEVYDEDDKKNDDLIGIVDATVGALAGAKNQTTILTLLNKGKDMGKLIVRCEKVEEGNKYALMKWKGVKLMNTDSFFDWWDKSDPYLKFLKIRSDNTFLPVKETEVINDSLNPSWRTIELPMSKLITNNQRRFKVQCWDHEPEGKKHQYIGEFFVTMEDLVPEKCPINFPLKNPKHSKPGTIVLESISLIEKPQFVDYLRGGLQLNLITAIDFTGSNGSPTSPSSLHYMNPVKPNQYQITLRAVADILLNYDSDKQVPAFGFGAKPRFPNLYQNTANHCFPLSGDMSLIEANGLSHLEALYATALKSVELAGPTYFAPLMSEAFKLARMCKSQGSNIYQILLILTDGEIHDMDATVDLIVENTDVPISIIIVGVGAADFTNMVRLDGDNGLFNSKGQKAMRDIVQFVSFRNIGDSSTLLAQQLLAELPEQVVQYMSLIGKMPNPPRNVDVNGLLQNELHDKNVEMVDNMFIKANFFDQFMNVPVHAGYEPPHGLGYHEPKPMQNQNMQASTVIRPTIGSLYESGQPNTKGQQAHHHTPYNPDYPMQSTKRM